MLMTRWPSGCSPTCQTGEGLADAHDAGLPAFCPLSNWTRAHNAGLSPPGQTGEGLGNAHDAGLPASRRHLKPEGVTNAHDTLAFRLFAHLSNWGRPG